MSRAPETLVVAGAGSGKTTLLLARAKYLVESGRAEPTRILALAFNKSAADELQERSDAIGIPMKAMTFHGFGNMLLNSNGRLGGVAFGENQVVQRFFAEHVSASLASDSEKRLLKFFSEMLVPVRDHNEFRTLNEYSAHARAIPRTLSNHQVKSHGELIIANHLYSRGLDFDYESIYEGVERSQWHRPDFTVTDSSGSKIFIEYFGVDGQNNTAPYIDREKYLHDMEVKRQTHANNGTTLVELTYQNLKDGDLVRNLEKQLDHLGVAKSWRTIEELAEAAENVGYTTSFVKLCTSFLAHVRAVRIDSHQLRAMRVNDRRGHAFITIFSEYLSDYEAELTRLGLPDFSAMIHGAADKLISGQMAFDYDHVLVDEYQDISADRQRLLEAMRVANPNVEFVYVGDDWQSINRFAGSDIGIMRRASRKSLNTRTVRLAETHRFPQALADVSSRFVQRNPSQLKKTISSNNRSTSSQVLYLHTESETNAGFDNLQRTIRFIGDANDGTSTLLVIARYNSGLPTRQQVERLWRGPFEVMSIHRSKGSEADYVIVMDVVQDFRGFPSTIDDDPILALVMPEPETYEYAEERRLFYVALTRARVACHLVTPIDQPSLFTTELLDQKVGIVNGPAVNATQHCSVCESGVLSRSQRDGGTHCSNSPYCEFRSPKCPLCSQRLHATHGDQLQFHCSKHPETAFPTCQLCGWGVLMNRKGKYGSFLGCTNYSIIQCKGKATPN